MEVEKSKYKDTIKNGSPVSTGPGTSPGAGPGIRTTPSVATIEVNDDEEYFNTLENEFMNLDFLSALVEAEQFYELDAVASEDYFEYVTDIRFNAPELEIPGVIVLITVEE